MKEKEGVMAAIMAALNQFEEEEALAAPAIPRPGISHWKHWGLGEMMRMRILWQLRIYAPATLR